MQREADPVFPNAARSWPPYLSRGSTCVLFACFALSSLSSSRHPSRAFARKPLSVLPLPFP
eukprot:746828-Prymnesium_polylepis.1